MFFRKKLLGSIGISCKAVLLTAAILVGLSGPVAAMDTAQMILHFWGDTYEWILEMPDDLEMLDTLEMN